MPSAYLEKILSTNILRESTLKSAIERLRLPKGSKGLDAGCGAGLQCLLLSEAVGRNGHVTGLDVSAEFLDYGRKCVNDAGLEKRISFHEGSVSSVPFADDFFDWVWSADFVGYGPMEPIPLLTELKRVTKPGGTVGILAWSAETLLPGYPLLEAQLRATKSGMSPFSMGMNPSRHFLRALGWFRELGFEKPKAHAFSHCVHAPLQDKEITALQLLFDMRWIAVEKDLSQDDHAEYESLCLPDSPDFILNHPDYCAFFTYTLFHGTAP